MATTSAPVFNYWKSHPLSAVPPKHDRNILYKYLGANQANKRSIYEKLSPYERYLAKMAQYDIEHKGHFHLEDYNARKFEEFSALEKKSKSETKKNSFGHSGGLGSRGMFNFQMAGNY